MNPEFGPEFVHAAEHDADSLRLRRQWCLQTEGEAPFSFFERRQLSSGFFLWSHRDARVNEYRAGRAKVIIIGAAAREDRIGPLLTEAETLTFIRQPVEFLEVLAGCYSVLVDDGDTLQLYTDPGGLATVYLNGIAAASTPTLLRPFERDASVDAQYQLQGTDNWYTGDLTPFKCIRVLLANHVLSLPDWRISRFWPQPGAVAMSDPAEVESRIANNISIGIRNLCGEGPVVMSLTGGRDSRVNLASVASSGLRLPSFTIRSRWLSNAEEATIGQLLRRVSIPHAFADYHDSPEWLLRLYDEMTAGLSLGARRETIGTCAPFAGPRVVHLNGNLGAIFLAFYWPNSRPTAVRVKDLASEFIQRPPCIIDGLSRWLATVPDMPAHDVYNLMYLEQRGGRWMGVGERASELLYDSYPPFCSRSVFGALRALPLKWQRGGRMLEALVRHLCPELAEVPFHSGTSIVARTLPKRLKVVANRILGRA